MADDRADVAPGTVIAGYRVTHRIGGGGMGTVYAAEEPSIRKRVAIKVLRHGLSDDASLVARFEREARSANDVRHPAIVDVFGFGKLEDGRPYLVMSLLEGRSLSEEIARRGRIPAAEAWTWAREIADALASAHAAGIVHRDLKPDNVFLERFGERPARPRLLDLGLVKVLHASDDLDAGAEPMKLTRSGVPIGTPVYMAPEQWWGGEVDARVDQYALGVTLFEMLAGHPPFRSQQFIELAQQHLNTPAPSLASVQCPVPAAVEAFVARALAKSPGDRFSSMADLVAAGDAAFASDLEIGATMAGSIDRVDVPVADIEPSPPPKQQALGAREAEAFGAREADVATKPGDAQAARRLRRFLIVHASVVVLGPLALVAVGYAGAARRDVREWIISAGWTAAPILLLFVLGIVTNAIVASRRARTGHWSVLPWVISMVTVLMAMLGTYLGWSMVVAGVAKLKAPARFEIIHAGMYELQLSRFLGFFVASVLLVSIAASTGLFVSPRPSDTLSEPWGVRRSESIVGTLVLWAIAIGSWVYGAASGALVAFAAGAIVALGAILPPLGRTTLTRDELERAIAGLIAFALVFDVALARVEARGAALWHEAPTRAARAAEIVATQSERTTTIVIGVVALAAFALVEIVRLRRIWRRGGLTRPGRGAVALVMIAGAVLVADLVVHAQFVSTRDRLHKELEAQFSLFARLDPPTAVELDPKLHAPHPAPALQIARNIVAVDGRPIAPLSVAHSPEGESNIGRDLSQALAARAAREDDAETDLAVSIDREVPWRSVVGLLDVARRSGVRTAELLLTRGPALAVPDGAPPEASWVLASDFVAVRIELADDGFRTGPDESFGRVAAQLVDRALAGGEPIVIATKQP